MQKPDVSNHPLNLYVYKASAGSGKTHSLTREYLRLLLDPQKDYVYRQILAVTFTNKATDEMKRRIIDELALLAAGEKSDYVIFLSEAHNRNEAQIRAKAYDTLVKILHDYSSFSVSTIDKFFQQTMRAFTREIGLGGGYNVELDTEKVLGKAVDTMLSDLEKPENKQLLDWLIRFSEEKVENGEAWNIRNDILALSSQIFKESYKAYSKEVQENISDKELMNSYKEMLFAIIRNFETRSQQLGEKGLNIITRYNLTPEDFKGGSRSPFKNLLKWAKGEYDQPNATLRKMENDLSSWSTSKTDGATKAKIEECFIELNSCLSEIIQHYDNSKEYQTAYEINRYFFTLGILGDIDKKIRDYADENNIMLISDTTELLSRIIEGNDSPFIYEKVGMRVNHFMIDEFQDTSGMQWNNFKPLVKDSLAGGNRNFIVGDVKQSIYRWRNSDWKLLDRQLDIDFRTEGIIHETLNTNWRSSRNVIGFNNSIFTLGARLLQGVFNVDLEESNDEQDYSTRIVNAYNDSHQHIPHKSKNNEGRVRIEFIDTDEHDWQSYVLDNLPHAIEDLQERGYQLKDIAILVRTKKEGAEVANRLLEYKTQHPESKYKYDIISDEALFVNNSKSIKLIVALLKYLQNPYDKSLKALAAYEYFKYYNQLSSEDALQYYFSTNAELPENIANELNRIRELPLYEMIEEIFELFNKAMESDDQVYIQSFLDMALDFTTRYTSDLDAFLKWWDESGVNKTIFTPDGQDAIRILTIHKSKGLGFNVVIIPFCNWDIDHKLPVTLWCQPTVTPFNQLHLVPVKYSSKLKNTIFEKEYFEEKLHAFIDNFNVLYVAFTRVKNELIAFAPKPKKDEVRNISSLLWVSMQLDNQIVSDGDENLALNELLNEDGIFEVGENYKPILKSEDKIDIEEIEIDYMPSIAFGDRLKLLLSNKYFFSDLGQKEYGTLMHEIVSRVKKVDDISGAVEDYFIQGFITSEQKENLIGLLTNYLSNPLVAPWYSGEYDVLNEVQILLPKGTFVRPDRIMIKDNVAIVIDYKFGEVEDKKYQKQVKFYVDQVKKMGYESVKGYVCYITLGKLVEVE